MKTMATVKRVHVPIVLSDQAFIPGWVVDLESFRHWARSEDFPTRGQFSFLNGHLWADLNMEQLFSHNQVKTEYTIVVGGLVTALDRGYFFSDRTFLSNPAADLSTEPDGMLVSWEAVQTGLVRWVAGAEEGFIEVEGTPDMVLEIISATTVQKDTKELLDLYWRAGIPEYWLVDGRGKSPRFDIYRHAARRYVATRRQDGWLKSLVLGRSFRLSQQTDRLGHPRYTLAIRP
jgi:Uma2 family endonuclease